MFQKERKYFTRGLILWYYTVHTYIYFFTVVFLVWPSIIGIYARAPMRANNHSFSFVISLQPF
jgi:hypothetical protein